MLSPNTCLERVQWNGPLCSLPSLGCLLTVDTCPSIPSNIVYEYILYSLQTIMSVLFDTHLPDEPLPGDIDELAWIDRESKYLLLATQNKIDDYLALHLLNVQRAVQGIVTTEGSIPQPVVD